MTKATRTVKTLATLALTAALALAAMLAAAPKDADAAWVKSGNAYYWRYDNGTWARNTWVNYNGAWYYFGNDYKVATNRWVRYAGSYYYIGANGKVVVNNWVSYMGGYYFMGADGKPLVNTSMTANGMVYYFGSDGRCISAVPEAPSVTFNQTVIFNQNGVKITFTSFADKSGYYNGPTFRFAVENNSNYDISFTFDGTSVNGWMVETENYDVVYAHSTGSLQLSINGDDLTMGGVEKITEVSFALSAWDQANFGEQLWSVPVTLRSSAAGSYTQTYDDSGEVLYSENGITIISKGILTNPKGNSYAYLLVINDSDTAIQYKSFGEEVNGSYSIYMDCAGSAMPGTRELRPMLFYVNSNGSFEYFDSAQLKTVKACIHLYYYGTYDIIDTPTVNMTF